MKRLPVRWVIGGGLIHLVITCVVGLATLGSVLGASPTYDPTSAVQFSQMFFWIWETGPMIANKLLGVEGIGIILLALLWSAVVGLGVGFAIRRKKGSANRV